MEKAFSDSYELSTGLPGEHMLPAELFYKYQGTMKIHASLIFLKLPEINRDVTIKDISCHLGPVV